ncbi:MAG: tyrosine--tRNA ligase [bacterium]
MKTDKALKQLLRGVEDVVTKDELAGALKRSRDEKKPLKIKYGCDPSAPDIHLGHAVVLRKLRAFQELGHTVQFLIGDFTARIGDPSGRSATRPPLSEEQVRANSATYQEQVFRILHKDKTEVVYNNDWLGALTPHDIVRLAASYTVARMLERNDFKERYKNNVPIRIHEFLYPLMQGYDSVHLKSDVEIGGSDQTFNILVGRELQKEAGIRPQIALTMPILEGLDGKEKMSKSLGNYVAVTDEANDMFGKLMSIPDTLIIRYFTLLTDVPEGELKEMESEMKSGKLNPRDCKARLGREIVEFFHGSDAAAGAEEEFRRVFAEKELPSDIPTCKIKASEIPKGGYPAFELVAMTGAVSSKGEARRMIRQKAVTLDDRGVEDEMESITPENGSILRVGKLRFVEFEIS